VAGEVEGMEAAVEDMEEEGVDMGAEVAVEGAVGATHVVKMDTSLTNVRKEAVEDVDMGAEVAVEGAVGATNVVKMDTSLTNVRKEAVEDVVEEDMGVEVVEEEADASNAEKMVTSRTSVPVEEVEVDGPGEVVDMEVAVEEEAVAGDISGFCGWLICVYCKVITITLVSAC